MIFIGFKILLNFLNRFIIYVFCWGINNIIVFMGNDFDENVVFWFYCVKIIFFYNCRLNVVYVMYNII